MKPKKSDASSAARPSSGTPGGALLRRLMSERNQYPERSAEIDRQVIESFARDIAVLVLDMCGFSRLTVEFGIIHYLAMIHQMQEAARPAVRSNGGKVIKFDADNLFAIFDEPVRALESALDIFRAFEAINTVVPIDRDIYGSIGIGYGETLLIDERDMFGSEVNIACKLGEDCALKNEILLTQAAHDRLPANRYVFLPSAFTIGDLRIDCYRFERSLFPKKIQEGGASEKTSRP